MLAWFRLQTILDDINGYGHYNLTDIENQE